MSSSTSTSNSTFSSLSPPLHPLLLRSLASLSFTQPTPIQSTLIPLALSSSQDILARARTGSGKTLAYALPLLQSILLHRDGQATTTSTAENETKGLILVPTRELAHQVHGMIMKLVEGLGVGAGSSGSAAAGSQGAITVVNIAGQDSGNSSSRKKSRGGASGGDRQDRMHLADRPSIVIATPSRALAHLRSESLHLSSLTHLIIDEADLILSYGHSSEDIRSILSGAHGHGHGQGGGLPKVYQRFLMSATMTTQVEELKGVVLRNPIILKLEEDEDELANLSQYCVRCSEEDKFLLLYVILKLKLIKGKCLIFVNDTDRGYRVKLFLEKFGIKSGVLNAELPFNSRYHAVQEFNRGVFDYLIATDESGLEGHDRDTVDEASKEKAEEEGEQGPTLISTQPAAAGTGVDATTAAAEEEQQQPASKKRKRKSGGEASIKSSTTEYGVSRGVDFVDVSCVLNFDLPFSSRSYTHRVGRTARAGRTGTSLSFIVPRELWGKVKKNDISLETAKRDEQVWARVDKAQRAKGGEVKEYRFDMKQVEGFRYRMEDGLRAVTKAAVREARIKEIKNEVVNSEKLKAHFEDNPRDLAFLRHDKPLHPARVQPHLKHVPGYLMPRIAAVGSAADPGAEGPAGQGKADGVTQDPSMSKVPFHKPSRGAGRGRGARGGGRGAGGRGGSAGMGRRVDPLKGGAVKFNKPK